MEFEAITLENKLQFDKYLMDGKERGCEFSFANLYMWGRQKACIAHGQLILFSQFSRRSVYPYPAGPGDKKQALDAIIADAHARGIPCRITGLRPEDKETLEALYLGRFRFHTDRDSYDYVYAIDDLADLKGRKYQRKRNHYNRFREHFPYYTVQPLTDSILPAVRAMVDKWYETRLQEDPHADFHMERSAIMKALKHYRELDMETLVLLHGEDVLAVTMGSRLSQDTLDVHFEKARADADGAYTAINCEFARYIRAKDPQIRFLNREDDMGLEGLRKAKLSYCPDHLVDKYWACLLEDGYDY